jgi:ribosome modulation factor
MSDAEEQGYMAYFRGESIEMNPYREDDGQYDEWAEGFTSAAIENEGR